MRLRRREHDRCGAAAPAEVRRGGRGAELGNVIAVATPPASLRSTGQHSLLSVHVTKMEVRLGTPVVPERAYAAESDARMCMHSRASSHRVERRVATCNARECVCVAVQSAKAFRYRAVLLLQTIFATIARTFSHSWRGGRRRSRPTAH